VGGSLVIIIERIIQRTGSQGIFLFISLIVPLSPKGAQDNAPEPENSLQMHNWSGCIPIVFLVPWFLGII
jgi:hypothetical protein